MPVVCGVDGRAKKVVRTGERRMLVRISYLPLLIDFVCLLRFATAV